MDPNNNQDNQGVAGVVPADQTGAAPTMGDQTAQPVGDAGAASTMQPQMGGGDTGMGEATGGETPATVVPVEPAQDTTVGAAPAMSEQPQQPADAGVGGTPTETTGTEATSGGDTSGQPQG